MATDFSTTRSSGRQYPKLQPRGANFATYRDRMEQNLLALPEARKHLRGRAKQPSAPTKPTFVDPSNPTEAELANLELYEELYEDYEDMTDSWMQREASIISAIQDTLPPDIHQQLLGVRPAAELWSRLCSMFAKQSVLSLTDILLELTSIKCEDGSSPEQAETTIQEIIAKRNDYIEAGGTLEPPMYAALLIKAMPKQYRPTIQTSITATGGRLVFDAVHAVLLESIRLDISEAKRDRETERVLVARFKQRQLTSTPQQSAGTTQKPKIRCENCNKPNHSKSNCWAKGGGAEGKGPGGNKFGKGPTSDKSSKGTGTAKTAKPAGKKQDSSDDDEGFSFMHGKSSHALQATGKGQDVRLLDSGASKHYEGKLENFSTIAPCRAYTIQTASGTEIATQKGTVIFQCHQGDEVKMYTLKNVYYLPSCQTPLISLACLRKQGIAFSNDEPGQGVLYDIRDGRRQEVMRVAEQQGVYPITTWTPSHGTAKGATHRKPMTRMEAHARLGHLSHATVEAIVKHDSATGFDVDLSTPIEECQHCIRAKTNTNRIAKERIEPLGKALGDHVSADLWGPARTASRRGHRYYGTYLDNHTGLLWLVLQKTKTSEETLRNYQRVEASIKMQHEAQIKTFHTDRGGEYTSEAFDEHLQKQGTKRSLTAHDTPQHNGAAERLNRTLLSLIRAMLDESGLPERYWADCAEYAAYLHNLTPSKKTAPLSPYEAATGNKPDLSRARRFGEKVWVKVDTSNKLAPRADQARWIGPSHETADGHRILWQNGSVTVERNVRFSDGTQSTAAQGEDTVTREEIEPARNSPVDNGDEELDDGGPIAKNGEAPDGRCDEGEEKESGTTRDSAERHSPSLTAADIATDDPDTHQNPPPRRSQRLRQPSAIARAVLDGANRTATRNDAALSRGIQPPSEHAGYAAAARRVVIPRSYHQAMQSDDREAWQAAMQVEIDSLAAHQTATIVPRSAAGDSPIIPLMWTFDVKVDTDGDVTQHKARVVARGDIQRHTGGYGETFAPVLKSTTRNMLFAVGAHFDWEIRQADFKGAYLNGVLTTPVFVEQPTGFDDPATPRTTHIMQLNKSLYGLKDSGRVWYDTLSTFLIEIGFTRSQADNALFYKLDGDTRTYIGIHVDDSMIVGNDLEALTKLEATLNAKFPMKILGDISHFLGSTITRDRAAHTLSITQPAYIKDVIRLCGLEHARTAPTPLNPGTRLGRKQCPTTDTEKAEMAGIPFREALGQLLWIANGHRPDIQFAVSLLSQFAANPGHAHWDALKHVVRYLSGTQDWRLTFGTTNDGLHGYSDASFGDPDLDWRSMTGYAFTLFGGTISWRAKKQSVVALSTAEAEYIALSTATREAIAIRSLLAELFGDSDTPIPMHVDNQSAISMAKTDRFHDRTKHIALPYHHVRSTVSSNTIALFWIDTHSNIADIFTKALDRTKVSHFSSLLGLAV